jgi:hypothetical protein
MKFTFLHGITKIFAKTPEKKLPDNFLNPLNNLVITTTTLGDEDNEDEEENELKRASEVE